MSDESASGSDPDLEPDVELEDAEEEEEEEEVAVEECGRDGEEDLLGGEWLQGVAGVTFSFLLWTFDWERWFCSWTAEGTHTER